MESRPSNENVLDIWTKDEHNEGGENSKWRGGFRIKWLYAIIKKFKHYNIEN